MTTYQLLTTVFSALLLLASTSSFTSAWVTPPLQATTGIRSTTQLFMFDWLNPKPKPSSTTSNKEDDNKKAEHKSDDFLSNMFNMGSPTPAAATTTKKDEEVTKTEETRKEEIAADAVEEVKKEAKKEDVSAAVLEKDEQVEAAAVAATSDTAMADNASTSALHQGTVSWFNPAKGFGFITLDSDDDAENNKKKDIFVHQTQIQFDGYRRLMDGEHVEFQLDHDEMGRPRALHVTGPNGGDLQVALRRKEKEAKEKET